MTTVVISQPMLFPWPGFFEQLALADVYIYLDDAQFSKGSYTNRIQVKLHDARKWMTIPLEGKGAFQTISALAAAGEQWKQSHKALLSQSLAGAKYTRDALALLAQAYSAGSLCEMLISSIELPARYLGLGQGRRVEWSSRMNVAGRSSQRVLDLVIAAGGTRYLTGHGAAGYLDHEAFEQAGVEVAYMDYSRTPYPQGEGAFTPYVTILDVIGRCGPGGGAYLSPQITPWRAFLAKRGVQSR